ncbi:MAG: hypothetical protein US15_C0037G0010 [Candidatus Moranbacteria bacterium GW2011_GWF1_36_4]|nr:MAG: hypothetical protein US15_C0037G0010 [Candidatus Moranbacteria bacterium GW2011_GWF1_36_4]
MKPFEFPSVKIPAQGAEKQESAREKILEILQENGSLEFHEGFPVLDLEKFTTLPVSKNICEEKEIPLDGRNCSNVYQLFFEQLGNLPVISKKDYDDARQNNQPLPEAMPLFNVPASKAAAFDLDNIKNGKYHLNYWDQYAAPGRKNLGGKWSYRIKAENGDEIGTKEMALATEIFRNHQGRRDADGNLLVFDKEKGDFTKLTAQWTRKNIGNLGEGKEAFHQNPHTTLATQCQNLLTSGLLKLADFHFATTKKGGEIQRREIPLSEIGYDISLDGVRYAIGKKALGLPLLKGISAKNITVVLLEKNKAGIIANNQDYKEVKYIIHLLDEEEKNKKRQEIIDKKKIPDGFKVTMYTILDKQETLDRIYPWDITQENPKRKEESSENYAKRLQTIKSYDFIQKITGDFSAKTGIGIHNLTWREQQWLAAAAYDLSFSGEMERLYSFANNYKLDGLKAFLSCEFDLQDSKKILNIGEKMSKKDAVMIFEKVAEIIDLAEKESAEIGKTLLKNANFDISSSIKLQLLKEARSIITGFSENIGNGADRATLAELIDNLRLKRSEITILSSLLKSLQESGQGINFEMIRDLDLDISGFGEELDENDKKEMLEMADENWQRNEKMHSAIISSLEKELENSAGQKYYVLRYKGKVIAFLKFKKIDDNILYFGSFNVAPGLQNLKLGNLMLDNAVKTEGKKKNIKAAAIPQELITSQYIEKFGFIADGIILNYQNTGEPLLTITADTTENKKYTYRNEGTDSKEKEEMTRNAKNSANLENLLGRETVILRFDMKTDILQFKKTLKITLPEKDNSLQDTTQNNQSKYKLTRYFQNKKEAGDIRYIVLEKIS